MTTLRDVIQAAYLSHPRGESWEDAAAKAAWQWFDNHYEMKRLVHADRRAAADLMEELRLHGRWGVREGSGYQLRANELCAEAAAEIERLRVERDAANERWRKAKIECQEVEDEFREVEAERDKALTEIERLTIENSER